MLVQGTISSVSPFYHMALMTPTSRRHGFVDESRSNCIAEVREGGMPAENVRVTLYEPQYSSPRIYPQQFFAPH